VPFGVPDEPPTRSGPTLRAELGLRPDATVALFWGGLWDWMDPALAVRAVAELRERGQRVELVFLAGQRPGGDTMRSAADEARTAVADLRLGDRVHFLDRWVPYAQRGGMLLDATIAISAHRPSVEARFAFRTRLLDCLWARLPPVCTRGDVLGDEAEREGWGASADPLDAAGFAEAVRALAEPSRRERARQAMTAAVERYQWSRSAATLAGLLDGAPAPHASMLWPGEVDGGSPMAVAAALGRKLVRRGRAR
jgi:glycosyltransferase involved in cell wall biosynthesis